MTLNPSGLCQCGCGNPAPVAKMTNTRLGHVKGEPVKFILGHAIYARQRRELTPDLWHIEDRGYVTPCWIWNGKPQNGEGYCRVRLMGKTYLAHRVAYEQFIGPIPAGLQIDHLCRQPSCVRPDHLEPVTNAENQRRGRAAKLNRADAELIRRSTLSGPALAKLLGVTRATIQDVRSGRSWVAE